MSYVKALSELADVAEALRGVKVNLHIVQLTPYEVYRKVKEGEIEIPEGIQRAYVWDKVTASRFIESLALGLPVPPLMLMRVDRRLLVIDGVQRITTLRLFFDNELRLGGVIVSDLDGKTWRKLLELERSDRKFAMYVNRLYAERTVPVFEIVIEAADERARRLVMFELFRRINLGAKKLTPTQVLFCTLSDTELIKAVKGIAESDVAGQVFQWSDNEKKRFSHYAVALSIFLTEVRKKPSPLTVMRRLYADTISLAAGKRALSRKEIEDAKNRVLDLLLLMRDLGFDRSLFMLSTYTGMKRRTPVNHVIVTSVYNALSELNTRYGVAGLIRKRSDAEKRKIGEELKNVIMNVFKQKVSMLRQRVVREEALDELSATLYDKLAAKLKELKLVK